MHLNGYASTNQKQYPDLDKDMSSVWSFWVRSSDVISRGNQWYRGVEKWRLFSQATFQQMFQRLTCFVQTFLTHRTKPFGGQFLRSWNEISLKCTTLQLKHLLICCLQCLWKPSKVRQICWLAMLVRSSPSVHWLKEIRARTKNHTLQHVFSYLYIHWKYPKLVQSQFYHSF